MKTRLKPILARLKYNLYITSIPVSRPASSHVPCAYEPFNSRQETKQSLMRIILMVVIVLAIMIKCD